MVKLFMAQPHFLLRYHLKIQTGRLIISDTPNDFQEYYLALKFGHLINNTYQWSKYGMSYIYIKKEDSKPEMVTLKKSINLGKAYIWEKEDIGNNYFSTTEIPFLKVKIGLYKGYIVIGTKDQNTYDLLFSGKPTLLHVSENLPLKNNLYVCTAPIIYKALNKAVNWPHTASQLCVYSLRSLLHTKLPLSACQLPLG